MSMSIVCSGSEMHLLSAL